MFSNVEIEVKFLSAHVLGILNFVKVYVNLFTVGIWNTFCWDERAACVVKKSRVHFIKNNVI